MASESDAAPGRSLPPVRTSALQVDVRAMAHAATAHANEAFNPKTPKPSAPRPRVQQTTLGALAASLKGSDPVDENAFDPKAFLQRAGSRVPKRTGAGLAGAALRKLRRA